MGLANVYAQLGLLCWLGYSAKMPAYCGIRVQKNQQAYRLPTAVEANSASVNLNDIILVCAGLIPLVIATGAGAVGNRTIGASALGGTLFGTIFGVLVIPGLYYLFANLKKVSH